MSRLERLKEVKPELAKNEDIQDTAQDIDTYAILSGFASSEAGKVLIEATLKTCMGVVETLAMGAKTMDEWELRMNAMKLGMHLEFVRSLTRARTNLEGAEVYLKNLMRT